MKAPYFLFAFLLCAAPAEAKKCPLLKLNTDANPRAYLSRMVPKDCDAKELYTCKDGYLLVNTGYETETDRFVTANCYKKDDPEYAKLVGKKENLKPSEEDQPLEVNSVMAYREALKLHRAAKEKGVPGVIYKRALVNYLDLFARGKTQRACFLAADLTRESKGKVWKICHKPEITVTEADTYYGSGLGDGCTNYNYRNTSLGCAKFFGNKPNYCLSAGGRYVTGPTTKDPAKQRPFTALLGQQPGENDNADERAVGIHPTAYVNEKFQSADYVGQVDPSRYSNGCLTTPYGSTDFDPVDFSAEADAGGMAVYVYPEKQDIVDFREKGEVAYWDSTCAAKIERPGWIGKKDSELDFVSIDKPQKTGRRPAGKTDRFNKSNASSVE